MTCLIKNFNNQMNSSTVFHTKIQDDVSTNAIILSTRTFHVTTVHSVSRVCVHKVAEASYCICIAQKWFSVENCVSIHLFITKYEFERCLECIAARLISEVCYDFQGKFYHKKQLIFIMAGGVSHFVDRVDKSPRLNIIHKSTVKWLNIVCERWLECKSVSMLELNL